MLSIVSEYPVWYIVFCILLGALYAYILYARDKRDEFTIWLKRVLFSLRFIAVTIIAFLLLSPLLKTISRYVEKPVIIIAQDNSKSIIINKDSSFYKKDYLKQLDDFRAKLSKNFEIKNYTFGDKITNPEAGSRKPFTEQQTDISELFTYIYNIYSNRNVGAIIIATDGIYNKGANPLYASANISSPVYTVALGDTNYQKDIILKKVNYNKTAYLGNTFPFEIVISANKCRGNRTKLTIEKLSEKRIPKKSGQEAKSDTNDYRLMANDYLYQKDIDINTDAFNQTVTVQLDAKKAGIQYYRISLSAIKDEISTSNNTREIFVEVLSNKQKVLILSSSPHPDISAIKQSLESNLNYQVDAYLLSDFNKNIGDYNLVILHELPSITDPATIITNSIFKTETPVLYIIGSKSNINLFNNLKAGLTITASKLDYDEAQPLPNNEFPLFTISKDLWNLINTFPPLLSPFGTYNLQNSSNVLFYQKIGNVATKNPLLLFNQTGNIRNGVITGEGIWRWNLSDYLQKNNHELFNELITKIAQYLIIKVDKSHFQIISPNSFTENEPVSFDAEVYNDSYELINEPDVNMTITLVNSSKSDAQNFKKADYNFVFSKTDKAYHLDAGNFPVGLYKYVATVKAGNNVYKKEGEFSISEINIETMNTVADHKLLFNISKKHNGQMFYPGQLSQLAETINKREDIKPVSYIQKRFSDIINLYWVFFFIIVLLSAEWFIRKYSGNY